MRLSKIVTLLLAGFLTFGSLNSVAATKHAKTSVKTTVVAKKKVVAKVKTSKQTVKAVKSSQKSAKKSVKAKQDSQKKVARNHFQSGVASYYADKFNGRRTANGETFNNAAMTAAHKTLPFGTLVEVTNMRNGKKVVVRVNDRGPYAHARVIDLSKTAARQLGMHHSGTAKVKLAILNKNKKSTEIQEEDI